MKISLCSALALLGLLSACAGPHETAVLGITEPDAPALSEAIVQYTVATSAPRQGPVLVDAPMGEMSIAPRVRALLGGQGYKVVDTRPSAPGVHLLSYEISPFGTGETLLRIYLDSHSASRLYGRDEGGALRPEGPFLAMEVGP